MNARAQGSPVTPSKANPAKIPMEYHSRCHPSDHPPSHHLMYSSVTVLHTASGKLGHFFLSYHPAHFSLILLLLWEQ